MSASAKPQDGGRGDLLLLHHCTALERLSGARPTARERLDDTLGEELAGFLVHALAGGRPLRGAQATAA